MAAWPRARFTQLFRSKAFLARHWGDLRATGALPHQSKYHLYALYYSCFTLLVLYPIPTYLCNRAKNTHSGKIGKMLKGFFTRANVHCLPYLIGFRQAQALSCHMLRRKCCYLVAPPQCPFVVVPIFTCGEVRARRSTCPFCPSFLPSFLPSSQKAQRSI